MGTSCLGDARWANVEYFPAGCLANDEDTVER